MHGQLRQNLAIDLNRALVEPIDHPAVVQPMQACRRIDAGDPQRAEGALALPTVTVGILSSLDDRLFGDTIDPAAGAIVALGLVENLLVRRCACTPRLTRAIDESSANQRGLTDTHR